MKEALSSSETSVITRATRRNIPENVILHSHRRENLKSYIGSRSWQTLRKHNDTFYNLWVPKAIRFITIIRQGRRGTRLKSLLENLKGQTNRGTSAILWNVPADCRRYLATGNETYFRGYARLSNSTRWLHSNQERETSTIVRAVLSIGAARCYRRRKQRRRRTYTPGRKHRSEGGPGQTERSSQQSKSPGTKRIQDAASAKLFPCDCNLLWL
jgi:hypothetical protein